MNKEKIIAKVLEKLSGLEPSTIEFFIKKLRKVAFTPEKIVPLFKEFDEKYKLKIPDKLAILKEVRKLNLVRIDVPDIVPEWKKALKLWGLPEYKIFH